MSLQLVDSEDIAIKIFSKMKQRILTSKPIILPNEQKDLGRCYVELGNKKFIEIARRILENGNS